MRVLVTGAFGYVGRAVTRRLLGAGHEVTALTTRGDRSAPYPEARLRVVVADLRDRDRDRLRDAVDGAEGVCHLAALTRVRESFERPDEYHAVNARGTAVLLYLLAEARRSRAGGAPVRFLQASTPAAYGA